MKSQNKSIELEISLMGPFINLGKINMKAYLICDFFVLFVFTSTAFK